MTQTPEPDEIPQDEPVRPASTQSAATEPESSPTADPAAEPEPKPLRPVDWDSSFSRTWNTRQGEILADRAFERMELESGQETAQRVLREEMARLEAQARRDGEAPPLSSSDVEGPAGDTPVSNARPDAAARQSLFDRMENFGQRIRAERSEDADGAGPSGGPADSAG